MTRTFQQHRHADAIRKIAGVQGHSGLNLIDDAFSVHDLCCTSPEHLMLRGEFPFSLAQTVVAVAGQLSRFHMTLGQGRRLAVIDQLVVDQECGYGWDLNPGASPVPAGYSLDARCVIGAQMKFNWDNNAASGVGIFQGIALAGQELRPGNVLIPGSQWLVFTLAQNQTVNLSVRWREFEPSDEERSG